MALELLFDGPLFAEQVLYVVTVSQLSEMNNPFGVFSTVLRMAYIRREVLEGC